MSAYNHTTKSFDEQQSIKVIREMIRISQRKLQSDGIMFIVWGWIAFVNLFFLNYLTSVLTPTYHAMQGVHALRIILPIVGLLYTVYYLIRQRKKAQTYIGISVRYVWISLFVSLILVNLVQFNVLHSINFELQHPIFMVFIAFAITVTGGILRHGLITVGGIVFAVLGFTASYFPLQEQLLIESIAWLLAFIIPGHILFSRRKV
jgi:hypothetical protein